jgi:hypothetical protein
LAGRSQIWPFFRENVFNGRFAFDHGNDDLTIIAILMRADYYLRRQFANQVIDTGIKQAGSLIEERLTDKT